jgi:hypothetical protein
MPTDTPLVASRRQALKRWIDEHFLGEQSAFLADARARGVKLNQGEVSGLLKPNGKSFGERRAAHLEHQARMPKDYLVQPADYAQASKVRPIFTKERRGEDDVRALQVVVEGLVVALLRRVPTSALAFLQDIEANARQRNLSMESGLLSRASNSALAVQRSEEAAAQALRRNGPAPHTKRGK